MFGKKEFGDMKKMKSAPHKKIEFTDEESEWLSLTPAERLSETAKLWKLYVVLGGSLGPEPDPQSPFYFPEMPR